MRHGEFGTKMERWRGGWRCTDVAPPSAATENVFHEYDMRGCSLSRDTHDN